MKHPSYLAAHIRRVLKDGGSAPHSEDVQRFFKEEVASRGWYTAELRRVARRFRRALLAEADLAYLLKIADQLFAGRFLEEKNLAVMLLERSVDDFGPAEFRLFESWLDRISSWADHDGLVYYLIAPMVAADRRYLSRIFRWARTRDRWHRRAACVALIRATRQGRYFPETVRLANMLLNDQDDMVQKGLGWLLRETAKARPARTLPLLLRLRGRVPRLVLRTACETLPLAGRRRLLA